MKYLRFQFLLPLVFVNFFLQSCYYDVEEELYPVSCDTTSVSFNTDIKPMIQNYCIACHNNSFPSGQVSLEGHNNVQQVALDGRLYGVVSHSPGFPAMPQGGNKLSDCQVRKIKIWADAGAPDN